MDFGALVSPVTDYLNFLIKYWSGDPSALSKYLGLSAVHPDVLLLSIVGLGFSLLIRYAKFGIIPTDSEPDCPGPSLDINSLLLLTFTSLVTPAILELSIYLLRARPSVVASTAYQTFNASLLSGAIIYPISGISNRLNYINQRLQRVGGRPAKLSAILHFVTSCFILYIVVTNGADPFLVLWGCGFWAVWKVFALTTLLFLLFFVLSGYFLWCWNDYLARPKS